MFYSSNILHGMFFLVYSFEATLYQIIAHKNTVGLEISFYFKVI